MTQWNFADLWEEVARLQPERPAIVRGDEVRSWAQFERRAEAVARHLVGAGLRPGSRVAQYMVNSIEFLESVFAAFKAAMVPVNTNYRYVADELVHLWTDSGAECVVFDAAFAPIIEPIRAEVPQVRTWLCVDDGTGSAPAWAESFARVASQAVDGVSGATRSGDDLYLLYTGGTTGLPKGVMWRQDDLLCVLNRAAAVRHDEEAGIAGVAATFAAAGDARPRVLPAAPLMHGTAAFVTFSGLCSGGTAVLCRRAAFDPVELLDTIEAGAVTEMAIVGDAFARPLLAALDAEPGRWDISSLRVMVSSGVMWSQSVKEGLIAHHRNLLCVDTLGSSEAVGLARSISSSKGTAATGGFRLGDHAQVLRDDGTPVAQGTGEVGLVAVRGRAPLGYFNDPEKSARTFRVLAGERWTTPGDLATVDVDGTVRLLGRGSGCINTGGEKVFPEEVEEALKLDPTVADVVVVGAPHERFGEQIVAFVEPESGQSVDVPALLAELRARIAGYKVPRAVEIVPSIARAANGKVDQKRWRARAAELVSG